MDTMADHHANDIKRRRRTTKNELAILEQLFAESRTPSLEARQHVCNQVNMTMKKLQVWLQNRRQKEKKDAGKWKPTSYTADGVKLANAGVGEERTISPSSEVSMLELQQDYASAVSSTRSSSPAFPIYPHQQSAPGMASGAVRPVFSHEQDASSRLPSIRLPPLSASLVAAGAVPHSHPIVIPPSANAMSHYMQRTNSLPCPPLSAGPLGVAPRPSLAKSLSTGNESMHVTPPLATPSVFTGNSSFTGPLTAPLPSVSSFNMTTASDGRATLANASQQSHWLQIAKSAPSATATLNAPIVLAPVSSSTLAQKRSDALQAQEKPSSTTTTTLKNDHLWQRLDSDPVEGAELPPHSYKQSQQHRDQTIYTSPKRIKNTVRMEDILGSARKAASATARIPFAPVAFPSFSSGSSASSVSVRSAMEANAYRKKRTRSTAKLSITGLNGLHRTPSLDSLAHADATSRPVNHESATLVAPKPGLGRSHSYNGLSTYVPPAGAHRSASTMMGVKKLRLAAGDARSAHAHDAISDKENVQEVALAPTAAHSTRASALSSDGQVDDEEEEDELDSSEDSSDGEQGHYKTGRIYGHGMSTASASMPELSYESNHPGNASQSSFELTDIEDGQSSPKMARNAARSILGAMTHHTPASAPVQMINGQNASSISQKLAANTKGKLTNSQIEHDCAAVLLGLGGSS